jgi:hypothetical protein
MKPLPKVFKDYIDLNVDGKAACKSCFHLGEHEQYKIAKIANNFEKKISNFI